MIGRITSQALETSKLVADWMEHRSGIVTALEHFLYEPVPKRGAWLYTLGSATLFTITLQFLTGILLLFYYVPTTDHAWDSIYYIMNEAYFGTLIRGIHYWSANFLLVVIGLHMAQVFFSGGYKAPRELNWVVGVILLLLVIVLAFTGYLLLGPGRVLGLRGGDKDRLLLAVYRGPGNPLPAGRGRGRTGHPLAVFRDTRVAVAGGPGPVYRGTPVLAQAARGLRERVRVL